VIGGVFVLGQQLLAFLFGIGEGEISASTASGSSALVWTPGGCRMLVFFNGRVYGLIVTRSQASWGIKLQRDREYGNASHSLKPYLCSP
jgi:hypothetical protein